MKRLLYIFLATIVAFGCSKDADNFECPDVVELGFSISDDLSRADKSDKTSWSVDDDKLAIFVGDTQTSKQYYISTDEDGGYLLLPVDATDRYTATTEEELAYTAYYPYEDGYTLSDYQTKSLEQDVLVATATSVDGVVEFGNFAHANSYLIFNFTPGIEYSNFTSVLLTLRNGAVTVWTHKLESLGNAASASYSSYSPLPATGSTLTLYMVANNDKDAYVVNLVNSYEGGVSYEYNLVIGTEQ